MDQRILEGSTLAQLKTQASENQAAAYTAKQTEAEEAATPRQVRRILSRPAAAHNEKSKETNEIIEKLNTDYQEAQARYTKARQRLMDEKATLDGAKHPSGGQSCQAQ